MEIAYVLSAAVIVSCLGTVISLVYDVNHNRPMLMRSPSPRYRNPWPVNQDTWRNNRFGTGYYGDDNNYTPDMYNGKWTYPRRTPIDRIPAPSYNHVPVVKDTHTIPEAKLPSELNPPAQNDPVFEDKPTIPIILLPTDSPNSPSKPNPTAQNDPMAEDTLTIPAILLPTESDNPPSKPNPTAQNGPMSEDTPHIPIILLPTDSVELEETSKVTPEDNKPEITEVNVSENSPIMKVFMHNLQTLVDTICSFLPFLKLIFYSVFFI